MAQCNVLVVALHLARVGGIVKGLIAHWVACCFGAVVVGAFVMGVVSLLKKGLRKCLVWIAIANV